jgi:hypothetical protein
MRSITRSNKMFKIYVKFNILGQPCGVVVYKKPIYLTMSLTW